MKFAVDWDNTVVPQRYNTQFPYVNPGFGSFCDYCTENGHELFILTARKPKYNPQIRNILTQNFIPQLEIINVDPEKPQQKFMVKWDVLIDDNHKLFFYFNMKKKKMGMDNRRVYLYDARWNQHIKTPLRVVDFNHLMLDFLEDD